MDPIQKKFRKGQLVKVDHKDVRGIVMGYVGEGFMDILCAGEHLDYRAHENDCQIHTFDFNVFDEIQKLGIINESSAPVKLTNEQYTELLREKWRVVLQSYLGDKDYCQNKEDRKEKEAELLKLKTANVSTIIDMMREQAWDIESALVLIIEAAVDHIELDISMLTYHWDT